ncbi:hypothetical protein AB0L85_16735 [Streptomyces sp. NPDC052051]|uniref:DUF7144 family membrane protein n=1 Tax=Streptomyces sp. NPDC052051 TaxID=3154649 RepID=UPI00343107B9
MTETPGRARPGPAPADPGRVHGVYRFAGFMLELSGVLSLLQGVSAVARDTLYGGTPPYEYRFDLTAWGWIHLVVGVALIVAGLGVLTGKAWGRGAGVAAAAVSLITQFMFIPHYPLWSISVMALDLITIWVLSRFPPDFNLGRR